MKFKLESGTIIYCKDNSYQKELDRHGDHFDRSTVKDYYKGYLIHREDGPAIEWSDGGKCWYKNGLLHRDDGPAEEATSGSKWYHLNGLHYTEKDYWKIVNLKNKNRVLHGI